MENEDVGEAMGIKGKEGANIGKSRIFQTEQILPRERADDRVPFRNRVGACDELQCVY